ncbi:head decoration protein [Azospirillum cavernae]|uniref:head decoration protein n=1 Tax=Azospirillum cavernae TaxID=2320860 RepID=UPI0018F592AB
MDRWSPATRDRHRHRGQRPGSGPWRGVGKITASGKYTLSAAAANDGSQAPSVILADAVDASGGDKLGVYLAGEFNAGRLVLGAGHTANSVKDTLRDAGIYLKTAVSAADPA